MNQLRKTFAMLTAVTLAAQGAIARTHDDWFNQSPAANSVEGASVNEAYEKFPVPNHAPVVVAVIDSGLDVTHPDLAGRLWTNPNEIPGNGLDDDMNGYIDDLNGWNYLVDKQGNIIIDETMEYTRLLAKFNKRLEAGETLSSEDQTLYEKVKTAYDTDFQPNNPLFDLTLNQRPDDVDDYTPLNGSTPDLESRRYGNHNLTDPHSHGTHVSGIIAAVRGNGMGIDGVATNVRLMTLRAVAGDERDKDVANAIRYAADNGARVINMSFGKGFSDNAAAVRAAFEYAAEKNVLMVSSAGNNNLNTDEAIVYPNRNGASSLLEESWLRVGASKHTVYNLKASFSNFGLLSVDLFAPGYSINSLVPNAGVSPKSGTSMASPVVAGLAALLLSHNPSLSAVEVKSLLMRGVRVSAEDPTFSTLSVAGGVVDAVRSLELLYQELGNAPAEPALAMAGN